VTYGPLPEPASVKEFTKNPMRFVPIPAVARVQHGVLLEKLEAILEEAEKSSWNKISGNGSLGIITSGVARAYVHDALLKPELTGKFKLMELGFTWPLPEQFIAGFLRGLKRVVIVEEMEPILETQVRALAQQLNIDVEISGKNHIVTRLGEYSTSLVAEGLAEFAGLPVLKPQSAKAEKLPVRPPTLCAGCSHRPVYFAVREVFGDDAVYSSDIGCYTLGIAPPLRTADFLYCMGSSISSGCGFARFSDKPVLAFIGDSTFFHSGITGLANAVHNNHNIIFVILDNGTTAMTGHQPNPAMQEDMLGGCVHLDIEAIARGCGVSRITTVKAFSIKAVTAALLEMKEGSGVRVIIAREPCVLYARRALKKSMPQYAYVAEQGECVDRCFSSLACPAFVRDKTGAEIDEEMCAGCMVCLQVSPKIKARKRS
jgi:indolepyruvate ferredoxin oxidoreductase alpha subunit